MSEKLSADVVCQHTNAKHQYSAEHPPTQPFAKYTKLLQSDSMQYMHGISDARDHVIAAREMPLLSFPGVPHAARL